MSDQRPLVAFAEDAAGDSLRGVVEYTARGYELLYLRNDVADRYTDDDWSTVAETFRDSDAEERESVFDVGSHYVTLRLYEGAAMLHFPTGEQSGVLLSLEPSAASEFARFATRCLDHIE